LRFSKKPYLVLFLVLISIGVGTAYAGGVLPTITLAGNVLVNGAGTGTPDAALHVIGEGSDITPNQNGVQITGSDVGGNSAIELTTNGGVPYIDFTNDITGTDFDARVILVGNDTLSIEGASVGIDTASPVEKLDINGDLQVRGNSTWFLNGDEAAINIGGTTDGLRIVGIHSQGIGIDVNGASDAFRLLQNTGNLGIGVASPTSKLHVNGTLTVENDIVCTDCIDSSDADLSSLQLTQLSFYTVSNTDVVDGGNGVQVSCSAGDVVVGMGGDASGTDGLRNIIPVGDPPTAVIASAANAAASITAWAICWNTP